MSWFSLRAIVHPDHVTPRGRMVLKALIAIFAVIGVTVVGYVMYEVFFVDQGVSVPRDTGPDFG